MTMTKFLWCGLVSTLVFVASPTVVAGARPGAEDALCDALNLRYRSTAHQVTGRELNFLLFDAAESGCPDLVTLFLDKGASVEARDRFGNSAFLIAARMGHNDILELLQQRDSDIHQLNLAGSSALLRAVTMNRRKTAQHLLKIGVDINLANKKGVTPLLAATFNGNRRLVKHLLDNGADAAAQDTSGKGPIVYAAGKGYLQILKLLLDDTELDVNARYGNDLTALMWAAGHSNDVPNKDGVATVEHLLSRGAEVDQVDNRGRSALMIAAERGHTMVVQTLIEHDGSAALKDKEGKAAIDLAANDEIKEFLLNLPVKD